MSRYFVIPEEGIGPGGDIVFRKNKNMARNYYLFVGDAKLGNVSFIRTDWCGLSYAQSSEFFSKVNFMEGFSTRLMAATFIIKHHGYWMRYERDFHARLKDFEQKFNQS